MLIEATPIKFRKRAGKLKTQPSPAPAPPAGPVLIGAVFVEGMGVQLFFDRPVNIDAMVADAFVVKNGPLAWQGVGWNAYLDAADVVAVLIEPVEMWSGTGVLLSAAGNNGIIAIDGAGAWAGVNDLELPFP